jgi:type I restriction enzyme, S subunit
VTGPLWNALPDGWRVGQVKHAATVTLGKMLQSKDAGSDVRAPYLRAANVQPDGVLALDDMNEMWFGEAELAQLSIRRGDVVVVEGGQGGFGRAAYVDDDLSGWGFQNSINRLRPVGDFSGRFIAFYLIALRASDFIRAYANVVSMPHLTAEKLARIPIPLPPLEEQRAIADYLDRETARIDTLIEEQQRLIELLRERRNAVVDRALSFGLDADLAQTGDPWLPVLPVGWKAAATKRLLSFGPSNGVSPEAGLVGDLRTLSLGAVRDGRVSMGPNVTKFVDRAAVPRLNDLRLRAGDILLVRGNGNVNLVGRAGLVGPEFDDEEYIYPDLLMRLRVGASMLPKFFVWAFNSAATRAQIGTRARTAVGTYKVAASDMRAIVLPLPSLSEQVRIVAYLDEQTAKIDSLIAETERFIELARERRAALITAAVTGQIDARELV